MTALTLRTGLALPAALSVRRGLSPQPGGGGPAPYHADAVHFDGSRSVYLSCEDTGVVSGVNKFTACAWVNFPSSSLNGAEVILFWPYGSATDYSQLLDIAFNNSSDLSVQSYPNFPTDPNSFAGFGSDDGAIGGDAWHFIFVAMDTSGSGVGFVQVDGVDVLNPANTFLGGLPFAAAWTEALLPMSGVQQGGAANPFDIADLQCWAGQVINPTVPANLAKFTAGGKPVNPSAAATAFGQQTFLFSGDAAGFATNQGTGGAFTTTGALTNASTSPSD